MSKITLNNLADLNNASTVITTINTNNSTIQTAMDNTLSRDGTQPNTMGSNLDMNNFRILNLQAPVTLSEPVRLAELNNAVIGVSGSSPSFASVPAHTLIIGTGSSLPNFTLLADAQILVGQTSGNDPVPKTISGAFTLADTGVATLATISSAAFPALTGDLIGSSGTLNVTVSKVNGVIYTAGPASNTVPVVTGASTITYQKVANAQLANMAAFTLKGNNTSSSGSPADFTVDSLTLKASPVGADEVLLWDVSGAAMKKATVSSVGSVAGVSSVNGQTGAVVVYGEPGGRLTLTSMTPVMTNTVTGSTIVYYTPYKFGWILIYNGTNFVPTTFSELSQNTTDATKSPAAVVANSNYDVFVWNDSGTIRATRGPAWTSNTARGSGAGTTQLTLLNGIHVNAVSITNGPAANQGTYVGTIRSNGTSTIDYIFGAAAASGTAANLNIWNKYNRVLVGTNVTDTSTYTYSSSTIRQADGSAGMQVNWISGLQEDAAYIKYLCEVTTVSASTAATNILIGLDSTTSATGPRARIVNPAVGGFTGTAHVSHTLPPQLGLHFIAALEQGDASNNNSINPNGNNALSFALMM